VITAFSHFPSSLCRPLALTSPIFNGENLIKDLSVAADAGTSAASSPEFRKLVFWRSTGERRSGRSWWLSEGEGMGKRARGRR